MHEHTKIVLIVCVCVCIGSRTQMLFIEWTSIYLTTTVQMIFFLQFAQTWMHNIKKYTQIFVQCNQNDICAMLSNWWIQKEKKEGKKKNIGKCNVDDKMFIYYFQCAKILLMISLSLSKTHTQPICYYLIY